MIQVPTNVNLNPLVAFIMDAIVSLALLLSGLIKIELCALSLDAINTLQ